MTASRRVQARVVRGIAGSVATAALATACHVRSNRCATGTPPSVISNPPRQWGRHAPPDIYPDPDIVVIDPSFEQYCSASPRSIASRTGFLWAEGPAWSSEGQYFVFSDVQGNTQYRFLWDNRPGHRRSASRRTTATATRSTSRVASFPPRISSAA